MARRQGGQLQQPAGEERVGANHERVGSIANKCPECNLDLAAVACLNDVHLHPDRGSWRRHVSGLCLGSRTIAIDQQPDTRSCGNKLAQ